MLTGFQDGGMSIRKICHAYNMSCGGFTLVGGGEWPIEEVNEQVVSLFHCYPVVNKVMPMWLKSHAHVACEGVGLKQCLHIMVLSYMRQITSQLLGCAAPTA